MCRADSSTTFDQIRSFFIYISVWSNSLKGSKLKPDAPEFVPTQSKPQAQPSAPLSKAETKEAAKAQKKQEKEERKIASLTKKAGKKAAKAIDRHGMGRSYYLSRAWASLIIVDGNASTADESHSTTIRNDIDEGNNTLGFDKPKPKRTRSSNRRHQAKSEPTNRPNNSLDGQQDSDMTAVSSGEGQPLLQNAAAECHFTTNPA